MSERYLAKLESGHGNASVLFLQQLTGPLQCDLSQLLAKKCFFPPPEANQSDSTGARIKRSVEFDRPATRRVHTAPVVESS